MEGGRIRGRYIRYARGFSPVTTAAVRAERRGPAAVESPNDFREQVSPQPNIIDTLKKDYKCST